MVESLPSLEDEDVEVDEELDVVLDEEEPVSSVIEIYNNYDTYSYVCMYCDEHREYYCIPMIKIRSNNLLVVLGSVLSEGVGSMVTGASPHVNPSGRNWSRLSADGLCSVAHVE